MGIRLLSIWNAFAFFVTLLFRSLFALSGRVPGPWAVDGILACGASATTWGRLCAQIANALWIYSMSVLYFRDGFTRFSPGTHGAGRPVLGELPLRGTGGAKGRRRLELFFGKALAFYLDGAKNP